MTTDAAISDTSTGFDGPSRTRRRIVAHTRGSGGPINRLVSPSDLGELIKPFVFLDHFEFDGRHAPDLETGWHPHSGIATVTVVLEGGARFAETTGREGSLLAGSVEYMQAGRGVWHTGSALPGRTRGFQLWVALPPHLESAPSHSEYLLPGDIPEAGPVRVVLGSYGGLTSPIDAPQMTYLAVSLRDGERWTYQPAVGHDVGWLAVSVGALDCESRVGSGEVAVFDHAETAVDVVAVGDTQFVVGSAPRHPHPLVLGNYSVHTTAAALHDGETEIRRIGTELREHGKNSYALAHL